MSRFGRCVGALCSFILTASLALAAVLADEPAGAAGDRLAQAKKLIESWDRAAPKIEFSEKWRAAHPISPFDPVVWAGDAERIAAVTGDSEVLLIDSAQGAELARFRGRAEDRSDCEGAKGRPRCVAISSDGKYVAIGFANGIAIWDWASDKVVFVHKEPVAARDLRISNDGKWLCMIDSRVRGGRFGLLDGAGGRILTPTNTAGGGSFKVITDPTSDRMVFRKEPLENYFEVAMDLPDGQGLNVSPILGNGVDKFAMGKRVRITGHYSGGLTVYMRREISESNAAMSAPIPYVSHWPTMTQIREVMVSPDDVWGLAYDHNDRVTMVRTDAVCAQWRGRLKRGRIAAVRPQLNEVVAIESSGEMVCHTIAQPTDHPAWEGEKWFRDALAREAYDEIGALMKVVASDHNRFAFLSHPSKFHSLRHVLTTFPPDPEHADQLTRMLQKFKQERPQNPMVAYLEALRLIDEGWDARGSGYASTVTPKQWEAFHKLIGQAHATLKPVIEGDEPPLDLYFPWFTIARAQGWPRAELDFQVDNLMRRLDRYHPALGEVAVYLLPRWGGSNDDASEFAEQIADRFSGEAGDIAYAQIAMVVARYEKDDTFSALSSNPGFSMGFDVERATRGVVLLIEQAPYSRDLVQQCKVYNGIVRSSKIAEALTKKQDPDD